MSFRKGWRSEGERLSLIRKDDIGTETGKVSSPLGKPCSVESTTQEFSYLTGKD